MKQKYYFDKEPKIGQINVISVVKNRASGQGENVKILKIKGKFIKVKSIEKYGDKELDLPFWVIKK